MKILMTLAAAAAMFTMVGATDSLAAKKPKKSTETSSAERKRIYNWALAQCRKQHGSNLHHVELQLKYKRYYCYVER
jgi:hypothetical protein